ncbi:hypothetical protein KJ765_06705 [Candidatus Micrarchaeota archaeon]|nr:hypothetical protein [Candidatus Micrarchaeota archaeon]
MKSKRRYLLYGIRFFENLSERDASDLVKESVLEGLGTKGLAESGARVKAFNATTQQMLVQTALDSTESVIAAFTLKRFFRKRDIALHLKKIFGTLRKSKPLFPDARPPRMLKRLRGT